MWSIDQFGARAPSPSSGRKRICAPADKNGEDPNRHHRRRASVVVHDQADRSEVHRLAEGASPSPTSSDRLVLNVGRGGPPVGTDRQESHGHADLPAHGAARPLQVLTRSAAPSSAVPISASRRSSVRSRSTSRSRCTLCAPANKSGEDPTGAESPGSSDVLPGAGTAAARRSRRSITVDQFTPQSGSDSCLLRAARVLRAVDEDATAGSAVLLTPGPARRAGPGPAFDPRTVTRSSANTRCSADDGATKRDRGADHPDPGSCVAGLDLRCRCSNAMSPDRRVR